MAGFDLATLGKLPKAVRRPELLRKYLGKQGLRFNSAFCQRFVNDSPVEVMDEDWDNLLLLDACRYDTFLEENWLPGRTESRVSAGSSSGDFLNANFRDRTYHDTVYLTANPHHFIVEDTFHAVVDLVHDDQYWDEELGTVHPETVVEAARDLQAEYPNKRYLIHFIQPHFPFIGETGREIDFDGVVVGHRSDDHPDAVTPWHRLAEKDKQAHETVREAYRENLRFVLEHTEALLEDLSGKSVISADHGNLLGERTFPIPVRGYGHPPGTHVPTLVTVPWHVIESDERRQIVTAQPREVEEPDRSVVTERLEKLGYVE